MLLYFRVTRDGGAGFLKREVLKPATGKDQTKFFCKRDSVSRGDKRL
jgi:hypothetical protein